MLATTIAPVSFCPIQVVLSSCSRLAMGWSEPLHNRTHDDYGQHDAIQASSSILRQTLNPVENRPRRLTKAVCCITVGHIYDHYGLEIALLYLERLTSDLFFERWIRTYLRGCARAMQVPLTIEAISSSDGMAALLSRHLTKHDARQPRMKGALVPLSTPLPLEIVARIVHSPLICKGVTRHLSDEDRLRRPCLLELERASIGMLRRSTEHTHLQYLLWHATGAEAHSQHMQWAVCVSPALSLTHGGIRERKHDDPITVQYSLAVYDKIWGDKKRTISMLQKMKRDLAVVTGRERDYIAGWVVQLSYDTSRFETEPRKTEFADLDRMRDELVRLIDIAISQRL